MTINLSEHLRQWRAECPSEWLMDEFIREAEQLQAENERLVQELEKEIIRKKESYQQEERLEEENRELKRKVFRRFGDEEYWIFSDDGEDYVESLVCPSVMSAAKLRELVGARAELEQLKAVPPVIQMCAKKLALLYEPNILTGMYRTSCIEGVWQPWIPVQEIKLPEGE